MNSVPIRKIIGIVGVFLLIITLLAVSGERGSALAVDTGTAVEAQIPTDELPVHFTLSDDSQQDQPWTDERRAAAQPYPLVRVPGEPGITLEGVQPEGEPGVFPSSPPAGANIDFDGNGGAAILSPQELTGYNYPPPYIRYKNFDSYLQFPYSTVGVLFFTQNGNNYRCSAASIGDNSIWTAGHCIHAGDGSGDAGKSTNIWFYPAYENGVLPFGGWQASDSFTTPQWSNGNCPFVCALDYDMGGAKLLPNGDGKTLKDVVGSLGFAYNQPESQHWFDIGYPSVFPFDGKWQYICAASFAKRDSEFFLSPQPPVGIGCDMTRGSSGGPWIVNFSGASGFTNSLNGNNSYRRGLSEEMFSPYFGTAAKNLWDSLTSK